jgi:DNA-binding transcriptional LysR family regulator
VRLTAAGHVLAAHASVIATQLERAAADLAACSAGSVGEVTIAAFATAITEVVAPAIASLRTGSPSLRVRVRDAEGNASVPLLIERKVDVAVAVEYRGAPTLDDQRILREPLYAEPFDVVLPPGHPLADMTEISLAALAPEPWIIPWPDNPCHDVVLLACERAGFQPRVDSLSDDFRAVAALAAAGAGVGLVPRSALRGVDLAGAVVRPMAGERPTRRVFTAVRRGGESHPLWAVVLAALRRHVPA